jgi:acetyl-CoA acyltransferase
LQSHLKALKAQAEGRFNDDIVPINVNEVYLDANGKRAERINVLNKMKVQEKKQPTKHLHL